MGDITCPRCKGSGDDPMKTKDCPQCKGSGSKDGTDCKNCNGKGQVPAACTLCGGSGKVPDPNAET